MSIYMLIYVCLYFTWQVDKCKKLKIIVQGRGQCSKSDCSQQMMAPDSPQQMMVAGFTPTDDGYRIHPNR